MPAQETSSRFEVFVGREREFAQLRDALDEASAGRGRLFLVSGEPGIGKTRLADQIAGLATSRGIRVLWGRCWEGDGAPAYWPWIQIIRALLASLDADGHHQLLESERAAPMAEAIAQIVPELFSGRSIRPGQPAPSRAPQSQFVLFDSVATLLKDGARLGAIMIVLDDLHDADVASLTMLRFLARELRTIGILLVGTYREAEVQRSPALGGQIGDIAREASSLPLAGLSAEEVADFFNQAVGRAPDAALAEQLYEATAGNPLFVDGVLRGLISQPYRLASQEAFNLPHSVREAIGRRLAKLSEQSRAVLKVAAAIGSEFDAAVCARVKEATQEQVNSWLDEAARDGIVIALGHGRYRFAHALIRSSIYEALDTNSRMGLHSAIANAIEELHVHNLDAHLDELAHHFREAGSKEKAIDYSHRAGTAARAVFAYAPAAEHWHAAEKMSEGQRDLRRADILYKLGEVEAFFVDPSQGVAHLEQALSLYRELNEGWLVASAYATLALLHIFVPDFAPQNNVTRALEYYHQAKKWQGEWPSFSLGWMHRGLGVAFARQNLIDEALTSTRRAVQIWREAGHLEWVDAGAFVGQLLATKGRLRESEVAHQEILQVSEGISEPVTHHTPLLDIGWTRQMTLDPLEARRFLTMVAEGSPNLFQREGAFESLVMAELQMGNLARAKELAAVHRIKPSFQSALARADGDFEGAAESHRTMLEWARRTGYLRHVTDSLLGIALSLRLAGDPKQAWENLEQAIRSYQPSDCLMELGCRPLAVSLAIEMGRPERAAEHLEVCRRIIANGEDWKGRAGIVERAEGMLAAAQQSPFAPHFENAMAIFQRYRLPLEEAETLTSWGSALLAIGNRAQADTKFDAAIEIYRRCGAGRRWIDRVEAARNKPAPAPSPSRKPSSTLQRDGDFWIIAHNGKISRIRNIKGLGYIARLLGHPGERIHVIDLVNAIEGADASGNVAAVRADGLAVERGLGDAGEVLDAQALTEYRRRQSELRAELDAARRDNDPGRVESAEHELEMVSDALTGALGRGGRARRNLSHVERARSLVTKHLRTAIDLIRRNDPALASLLDRSIQTGTHCAYLLDSSERIEWQV